MKAAAPLSPAEGRQWLQLRQLRVRRARERLALAQAAERDARGAVAEREQRIADGRERLAALARHWGGAGCVDLPRWSGQLAAHREALAERLERDEYALIDEQQALDRARAELRQCEAELARAQAREDAVGEALQALRRDRLMTREQQAELEAEDARRPLH